MAMGTLIYKCRVCGEKTDGAHTPDAGLTLTVIANDYPLPDHWIGTSMATKTTTHFCSSGTIGIADLVGARLDESKR